VSSSASTYRRGRRRHALQACALVTALASAALTSARTTLTAAAAPFAPQFVVAQALSDTVAQVSWVAVSGATSYSVFRDGSLIHTGTPTYINDSSGLGAGSSPVYTVTATDAAGTSSPTSAARLTMQQPVNVGPPNQPGAITVTQPAPPGQCAGTGTQGSVLLNWAVKSVGVEGYRIDRGDSGPLGTSPLSHITTADTSCYVDTGLLPGDTYHYEVAALDVAGNISQTQKVDVAVPACSGSPAAPNPPQPPVATAVTSKRVDITWNAATGSALDVAGYNVIRDSGASPIATVWSPAAERFTDQVTAGSTHTYAIQTIDACHGMSTPTATVSVTTPATDTATVIRGPMVQSIAYWGARVSWWTNVPTRSQVVYAIGSTSGATYAEETPVTEHVLWMPGPFKAASTYQYTVGDGGSAKASGTFRSVAGRGSTFSFSAIGDYGSGTTQESNNAVRMAAESTDFTQTLGDNVYSEAADPGILSNPADPGAGTVLSNFDENFYRPMSPVMSKGAFIAANGNHEYYGPVSFTPNTPTWAWFQHMWQPNNMRWFGYDWGDAHILVLDSEQPFDASSPQYAFAQSDLQAHQSATWRIVITQRPPFSSISNNSSDVKMQQTLGPLWQQQRVSLVLSGNSHNYERTYKLTDGTRDDKNGISYVVSGGGGSSGLNFFRNPQPATTAFREDTTYEHLKVTVSPSNLHVDAISDAGAILDSTDISPSTLPPPGGKSGTGYWLVAADGGIFPFGTAAGFGSTGGMHLNQPIVGMDATPTGRGYWLVASDGGIFPFGDAGGYGSTGGIHLNQPIVGMASTPSGHGYWLVASDGGIFPFGDAKGYGSTGGFHLNRPVVGMAATKDGHGYWLVASDGGIFPFGSANGYGSTGGFRLNQPIVGMDATPTGLGYWLVAGDGGIFPFGDAGGFGSTGGIHLNKPIVGMNATPDGRGYWLVASDGGIFPFGSAAGYGSTGNIHLNQPIVGMSAR
jgi:hypothetical protein